MVLEDFNALYCGVKETISDYGLQDINSSVLKLKSHQPVKFVDSSKYMRILPRVSSLYSIFNSKFFFLIPIETISGGICGFIVRSYYNKEYRIIFDNSNLSPMFGWYNFVDYELDSPIILTEGVKDCIYLKTIYPYILSLNTASLTYNNLNVLKCLTNKVILCYDNDSTGLMSIQKDVKLLNSNYISTDYIVPQHKDAADYYNKEGADIFKRRLLVKIKSF